MDWKVSPYHKGGHGFFVMIATSGVVYQLNLQILLGKPTVDGKVSNSIFIYVFL